MELLEPAIVAGSYLVKMGGFRLSLHVSPCSETCYNTWRIKMPKEPSGGSEAFPCISNQGVIFLPFSGKILWVPARRAEKMWIQSSSKSSSALISEQKHSDPPSYFIYI